MTGFKFTDGAGAVHTVNVLEDGTWSTAVTRVSEVLGQRFPRPQEVEDRAQLERRVISAARFFRASEVTPPLGHVFTPSWIEDAPKWDGLLTGADPIDPNEPGPDLPYRDAVDAGPPTADASLTTLEVRESGPVPDQAAHPLGAAGRVAEAGRGEMDPEDADTKL